MSIVATTARLTLRSWRDDDREPMAAMAADLDFVRYLGGRPWELSDAAAMIERCRHEEQSVGVTLWALEDRQESVLVGYCGLAPTNAPCLRNDLIEIGWGIERSRWGDGLATEAATTVLEIGARRFAPGRVVAKCHVDNVGSERVMQRIGLRRAGIVRYLPDAATPLYRAAE